jgi:putative hydrolase of the HAD superfamily
MKKLAHLPTHAEFAHVTDWVFDLDNTLYPHHVNLFAQIDRNMTAYVHHGVDPNDFLERAHAIDYSVVPADPALGEAIKALPGRKFIFTNGSTVHAEMTARALGILDHFDNIFDIVAAGFVPKPAGDTYDKFMSLHRVDTQNAVMFEDLPRNLLVPKALGMKTVLLVPHNLAYEFAEAWETSSDEDEQIDYITEDLAGFLRRVVAEA